MARILALLTIHLVFCLSYLSSQTPDAGRWGTTRVLSSKKSIGKPLIRNYPPKAYGVSWQNISVPDSLYRLALAINGQRQIYLGGGKDIGYLSLNPVDRLQFHFLLSQPIYWAIESVVQALMG